MRVRGRGVPASGKNAAGDLLVTVNVTIPQETEQVEQEVVAVEKLAAALNKR